MGTLTKFSNPMPKKGTAEVETMVEETAIPIEFSPRKLIDRKTASVLLLFIANVGIGIAMILYRSCDSTHAVPYEQATLRLARENDGRNNSSNKQVITSTIFVQVIGQVKSPGVYQIPVGSKVCDAIAFAGGSLSTASLDSLNLTRVLSDEEQIVVP